MENSAFVPNHPLISSFDCIKIQPANKTKNLEKWKWNEFSIIADVECRQKWKANMKMVDARNRFEWIVSLIWLVLNFITNYHPRMTFDEEHTNYRFCVWMLHKRAHRTHHILQKTSAYSRQEYAVYMYPLYVFRTSASAHDTRHNIVIRQYGAKYENCTTSNTQLHLQNREREKESGGGGKRMKSRRVWTEETLKSTRKQIAEIINRWQTTISNFPCACPENGDRKMRWKPRKWKSLFLQQLKFGSKIKKLTRKNSECSDPRVRYSSRPI